MGQLHRMCDEHRVPHSILFHEDSGCGGLAIALAFAEYILCSNKNEGDSCGVCPSCNKVSKLIHPDIHFVFPSSSTNRSEGGSKKSSTDTLSLWRECVLNNPYMDEYDLQKALNSEQKTGLIKVDQAKEMLEKLNISSFEGGNKFMIVFRPERMNAEAANKLLKMIEEPFPGTIFLFVTSNPEKIITTIRSRCVSLRVHPLDREELTQILIESDSLQQERAKEIASISMGSYGNALKILREERGGDKEGEELFYSILDNVISRELLPLIDIAGEISVLGREAQRRFCLTAEVCLRKIFMSIKDLSALSYCTEEERGRVERYSGLLSEKFCVRSFNALDKAIKMIDSNVNSKVVFCNLTNRFFVSL